MTYIKGVSHLAAGYKILDMEQSPHQFQQRRERSRRLRDDLHALSGEINAQIRENERLKYLDLPNTDFDTVDETG